MRHSSPLRYPGGKSSLCGFLTEVIDLNGLRGCSYFEPYAGGAGAALKLLDAGAVSDIRINDADVRICAFWRAALRDTERFARRVEEVPLTMDEWRRQKEICANPGRYGDFDTGFAAFYMNRCNRSGVLDGAGPIGGYGQEGSWKMDARFNRESLAGRILKLGEKRGRIRVFNKDAVRFLKECLPRGRGRKRVFVYLDPPYVSNGRRLYLNAYGRRDHVELAKYVLSQRSLPWIMSYDDDELIRDLYGECEVNLLPTRYTLQTKRKAHELIISPGGVAVPFNGEEKPLSTAA